MNIWYFHHYATPTSLPGLHRPYEFANILQGDGHTVTVFASSFLHFADINLINNKSKYVIDNTSGVSFVYIRTPAYQNSGRERIINMLVFYCRIFGVIKEYLKIQKPDVIIASSPHPFTMIAGQKIANKLHVPCICEVRDFWPEALFRGRYLKENSLMGKLLIYVEHKIYKKADAIIFLKEGDIEYIKEHRWDKPSGGDIDLRKCFYINNGVQYELFQQNANEFTLDDKDLKIDTFKVIYCGSIRPVNHVELIVDAAEYLLKQDSNIEFLIYGDGSCLSNIKQRIADRHLTNIKIKGYVDNKYIPYILRQSSLNILNYSNNDYNWARGNSSNKLFEYLASGRPVLSTVKMGYCLLKRYQCGISAESCTPEQIGKAILFIKELSVDEYMKMCKNAMLAAQNFDYRILTDKLINAIEYTLGIRKI